ncbi:MAG TPA: FAD-binding oxidoreductase [Planctomycetes bacterium]|nr:FAD-binding oxidoreductase [Planctomycetota bacterium]
METDILILGGGVAGLATAWRLGLAGSGEGVLLCERERTLGSMASAQNAAILRTFATAPMTARIARASARFIADPPEGFSPVPLLDPVGLLLLASGETAHAMETALDAMRAESGEDLGAVRLGRTEIEGRYPLLSERAASAELALFFPGEGRIDTAALLDGFAAGARDRGAALRTNWEARDLLVEAGVVRGARFTNGETIRARRTVLAAGAWAGKLGAAAGSHVALRPTRRHLLVTAPDPTIDPNLGIAWIEDEGFYCRPESGGLLLSACDLTDVDPDRAVDDPEVKALVAEKTARFLRGFDDAPVAHFWHGLRTLTPDDHFAIGPDPDLEGLFWVAGLGGHGMSCGPEAGRLAAVSLGALAARGGDEETLRALSPARLRAASEPG